MPLADGGEGTLEVIQQLHGGTWITVDTFDSLMRPIQADYLYLADQKTAYIEMARASGLALLAVKERKPLKTSTFGTGVFIADALTRGATQIILTIGGSATNDAGIGMAAALGWKFLDVTGAPLDAIGENLIHISSISAPALAETCIFTVVTDVTNPLAGPSGAAHVFAAQKGASAAVIKQLDKGLNNIATFFGSIASEEGAGAAGGLGFGLMTFLGGRLVSGFDMVATQVGLEARIAAADLIVTGEGRLDEQSLQGKGPVGVARLARRLGKKIVGVAGSVDDSAALRTQFDLLIPIKPAAMPLDEAMRRTGELIETAVRAHATALRALSS